MIEVLDQGRAVMLLDQVNDLLGQVMLPTQVEAIFHMADDDQRTHGWSQVRMRFVAPPGSR